MEGTWAYRKIEQRLLQCKTKADVVYVMAHVVGDQYAKDPHIKILARKIYDKLQK